MSLSKRRGSSAPTRLASPVHCSCVGVSHPSTAGQRSQAIGFIARIRLDNSSLCGAPIFGFSNNRYLIPHIALTDIALRFCGSSRHRLAESGERARRHAGPVHAGACTSLYAVADNPPTHLTFLEGGDR